MSSFRPARASRALPGLLLLALSACAALSGPQIDPQARRARIQIRQYAFRMVGLVEAAADRIAAEGDDPDVERAATEWKIAAIPQVQTVCFQPNPGASVVDAWAYAIQLRQYFEATEALETFGVGAAIGLEAAQTMDSELADMIVAIQPEADVVDGRRRIEEWAHENPLSRPWTVRESIVPSLSSVLLEEQLDLMASLGRLAETTSDIMSRMSLYNEVLPKQVRWQTELVLDDLEVPEVLAETRVAVPEMVRETRRAVAVLEDLPAVLESERAAVVAAVDAERALVLDDLERMRLDSHERVTRERQAVLRELRAERELVMAEVAELVDARWERIGGELPQVGRDTLEQSQPALEATIDHAALRLAQLGAAALAGAFVAALVLTRRRRAA